MMEQQAGSFMLMELGGLGDHSADKVKMKCLMEIANQIEMEKNHAMSGGEGGGDKLD